MIKQPVPFYQRCFCSMKNSPRRQACLKATVFAIEELSIFEIPRFFKSALRTYKASLPPLFNKVLFTCFIAGERFLKLYQAVLCIFLGHSITCPRNMPKNKLGVKCIGILEFIISYFVIIKRYLNILRKIICQ